MKFKNSLSHSLLVASKQEAQHLLDELIGVKAVVISTVDGFDIASAFSDEIDPARVAAMSSSIAAIGNVVAGEAELGTTTDIIINCSLGFVQVFNVNRSDHALIVNIVSDSSGVLAQVSYRGRRLAKSLASA